MSIAARKFAEEWGGIWGEYPEYTVTDWASEVANDDTRASYWDWVLSQIAAREDA